MLSEDERRVFASLWTMARILARGRDLATYLELSDVERKFWDAVDGGGEEAPARLLELARWLRSRSQLGCAAAARASLIVEAAAAYLQAKLEAGGSGDPVKLLRSYL